VDSIVNSAINEAKAPPGTVPATPNASTPIQEGCNGDDPMDFDITSSQEGKKIYFFLLRLRVSLCLGVVSW
jgi:hypothetical protein